MKTICHLIISFALLFTLSNNVLFASSETIDGSPISVCIVFPLQGETFYSVTTAGHNIGYKRDASGDYERSRTLYSFHIGVIPSDAIINSVTLKPQFIEMGSGGHYAKITLAEEQSTNQSRYSNIASAQQIFNIIYGSTSTFSSSTLKNAIQNTLGDTEFYLGAYSSNETSSDGWASLDLTLIINYTDRVTLTAQNIFIYGSIKVGVDQSAATTSSPRPVSADEGQRVYLQAVEQFYSGYNYIWNDTEAPLNPSKWEKISSTGGSETRSFNQSYDFPAATSDEGATYEAGLRKVLNVTLKNSFNGGSITVNGTQRSAPYTEQGVIELNNVEASVPLNTTRNYVNFRFQNWSDGSTTYSGTSQTFNPSSHKTYTAKYKGTVNNLYRSMRDTGQVGDPIVIVWDEHPDPNVTHYKVYRQVKSNGVMGPQVLVATKQRGSTSYTDNSYVKTRSYVDLIQYDVRGYYSPDDTYPDADFFSVYGEIGIMKENDSTKTTKELPKDYALSNYPNPFNPSTNISFTIPEAQNVKLLVYNLLGEKVKELVNNSMQAGSYNVKWNGDNQFGRRVNSGVYFSVLQTQEKRIVKKMILSK